MAKKKPDAETPVTEDAQEQQPERPKLTKAEAVRLTLRDGIDTPAQGIPHIKQRYGLDITAQMFSAYKSNAKKKAGAGESGAVKVAKESGAVKIPANGSARIPVPSGNGDMVASLEALKGLVDELGVEQVVRLAQLFA
jgi:hypothetical protein